MISVQSYNVNAWQRWANKSNQIKYSYSVMLVRQEDDNFVSFFIKLMGIYEIE